MKIDLWKLITVLTAIAAAAQPQEPDRNVGLAGSLPSAGSLPPAGPLASDPELAEKLFAPLSVALRQAGVPSTEIALAKQDMARELEEAEQCKLDLLVILYDASNSLDEAHRQELQAIIDALHSVNPTFLLMIKYSNYATTVVSGRYTPDMDNTILATTPINAGTDASKAIELAMSELPGLIGSNSNVIKKALMLHVSDFDDNNPDREAAIAAAQAFKREFPDIWNLGVLMGQYLDPEFASQVTDQVIKGNSTSLGPVKEIACPAGTFVPTMFFTATGTPSFAPSKNETGFIPPDDDNSKKLWLLLLLLPGIRRKMFEAEYELRQVPPKPVEPPENPIVGREIAAGKKTPGVEIQPNKFREKHEAKKLPEQHEIVQGYQETAAVSRQTGGLIKYKYPDDKWKNKEGKLGHATREEDVEEKQPEPPVRTPEPTMERVMVKPGGREWYFGLNWSISVYHALMATEGAGLGEVNMTKLVDRMQGYICGWPPAAPGARQQQDAPRDPEAAPRSGNRPK